MLQMEGVHPSKLAYDRPSEKLIGFLAKHYNLVSYVPQNNKFVVFNQYFSSTAPAPLLASNNQSRNPYDKSNTSR